MLAPLLLQLGVCASSYAALLLGLHPGRLGGGGAAASAICRSRARGCCCVPTSFIQGRLRWYMSPLCCQGTTMGLNPLVLGW
jgi:hypothetical protein